MGRLLGEELIMNNNYNNYNNNLINVSIKVIHPSAKLPVYGSEFAAGFDISCVAGTIGLTDEWVAAAKNAKWIDLWSKFEAEGQIIIQPGAGCLFRSGFATSFSADYVCLLQDRSGLATYGEVSKQAGVIDSDYRGEWFIKLINLGTEGVVIRLGDRIVQGIFVPVYRADFKETDILTDSVRSTGGLGSTGLPFWQVQR